MNRRVSTVFLMGLIVPAAMASLGGGAFRIEASSELGNGSIEISASELIYNPIQDSYSWQMAGPRDIRSESGALIGTLNQANVLYVVDPIITLNFLATAGGAATTFTITSALLSFPTINPAEAQASAGITVTDNNGDGATIAGLLPGSRTYGSNYNGLLATPFAYLASGVSAAPNQTAINAESFGFATIGAVSDMSSQWDFRLTAFDSASGTSRYEVRAVPEPATLAVLGLGMAALLRRRR